MNTTTTKKTKLDEVCDALTECVRVGIVTGETEEDLFMRLALSMEAVTDDDRLYHSLRLIPAFVKLWRALELGLEKADNALAGDDPE